MRPRRRRCGACKRVLANPDRGTRRTCGKPCLAGSRHREIVSNRIVRGTRRARRSGGARRRTSRARRLAAWGIFRSTASSRPLSHHRSSGKVLRQIRSQRRVRKGLPSSPGCWGAGVAVASADATGTRAARAAVGSGSVASACSGGSAHPELRTSDARTRRRAMFGPSYASDPGRPKKRPLVDLLVLLWVSRVSAPCVVSLPTAKPRDALGAARLAVPPEERASRLPGTASPQVLSLPTAKPRDAFGAARLAVPPEERASSHVASLPTAKPRDAFGAARFRRATRRSGRLGSLGRHHHKSCHCPRPNPVMLSVRLVWPCHRRSGHLAGITTSPVTAHGQTP